MDRFVNYIKNNRKYFKNLNDTDFNKIKNVTSSLTPEQKKIVKKVKVIPLKGLSRAEKETQREAKKQLGEFKLFTVKKVEPKKTKVEKKAEKIKKQLGKIDKAVEEEEELIDKYEKGKNTNMNTVKKDVDKIDKAQKKQKKVLKTVDPKKFKRKLSGYNLFTKHYYAMAKKEGKKLPLGASAGPWKALKEEGQLKWNLKADPNYKPKKKKDKKESPKKEVKKEVKKKAPKKKDTPQKKEVEKKVEKIKRKEIEYVLEEMDPDEKLDKGYDLLNDYYKLKVKEENAIRDEYVEDIPNIKSDIKQVVNKINKLKGEEGKLTKKILNHVKKMF